MTKPGEISTGERTAALRKVVREMSRKCNELQAAVEAGASGWDRLSQILTDLRGLSAIADELMPPERP